MCQKTVINLHNYRIDKLRAHIPEQSNFHSFRREKCNSHILEDSDIHSSAAREHPV
jgi:hypothetical protein